MRRRIKKVFLDFVNSDPFIKEKLVIFLPEDQIIERLTELTDDDHYDGDITGKAFQISKYPSLHNNKPKIKIEVEGNIKKTEEHVCKLELSFKPDLLSLMYKILLLMLLLLSFTVAMVNSTSFSFKFSFIGIMFFVNLFFYFHLKQALQKGKEDFFGYLHFLFKPIEIRYYNEDKPEVYKQLRPNPLQ